MVPGAVDASASMPRVPWYEVFRTSDQLFVYYGGQQEGETVCIDLVTGKLAHSVEPLTIFSGMLLYD